MEELIFEQLATLFTKKEKFPVRLFPPRELVGLTFGEVMARIWKLQNEIGKNLFFLITIFRNGQAMLLPSPDTEIKADDRLVVQCFIDEKWDEFIEELFDMDPITNPKKKDSDLVEKSREQGHNHLY